MLQRKRQIFLYFPKILEKNLKPKLSVSQGSQWSSLYFVLYLYLAMFFFSAVIIGVIIDAYWTVSKSLVKVKAQK